MRHVRFRKFELFSHSAPPSPRNRTGVPEITQEYKAKSKDDSECILTTSIHAPIVEDGVFSHRKNPSRSPHVQCSRCSRLATFWCVECAVHLCEFHDRRRHRLSMFSRHYHNRNNPVCADVDPFQHRTKPQQDSPAAKNSNSDTVEVDDLTVNDGNENNLHDSKARKNKRRKPKRPTVFQNMRSEYDNILMVIIRPPRCAYSESDLGPSTISVGGGLVMHRRDFEVSNRHGLKLRCSQWRPSFVDDTSVLPCVVYLHGNSSARIDVVRTRSLSPLGAMGCTVVAFDFSGSGLSEGDYVTLGGKEQHDVADVLSYLRQNNLASRFTIWGRSMGAASALLYAASYGTEFLSGLVLDSPFASFRELSMDLVAMGQVRVPKVAVRAALALIRRSVKKRTSIDIRKLTPVKGCRKIMCPALFISAVDDKVVPPHHSVKLSNKYKGPCYLISCCGRHNSARPEVVQDSISMFIRTSFRWPQQPIEPLLESIQKLVAEEESHEDNIIHDLSPQKPIIPRRIQKKTARSSASSNSNKPSKSELDMDSHISISPPESSRASQQPLLPHRDSLNDSKNMRLVAESKDNKNRTSIHKRGISHSFLNDFEEDEELEGEDDGNGRVHSLTGMSGSAKEFVSNEPDE